MSDLEIVSVLVHLGIGDVKRVPGTDNVFVYPNTYLSGSVNQGLNVGSDLCHGLLVTKITRGGALTGMFAEVVDEWGRKVVS